MEIRNCPECHDEVVAAGLALWGAGAEAVEVFECVDRDCGWAGIEAEYWASVAVRPSAA